MKVMLADDEQGIRTLVGRIVKQAGYEFCSAEDGEDALRVFDDERPDLVILDIMMPKLNGFQVCERLRERGVTAPVLFLSAKGDIVDKAVGFESGGDDYITKPFSPEELVMRIKAHLRQHTRAATQRSNLYVTGGFTFDVQRHLVSFDDQHVELTPKEFQIVYLLASHPGDIYTREQLVEEVWGKNYVGEVSSVAVYVRKIREKIERDPSKPEHLQTVRSIGYRFVG